MKTTREPMRGLAALEVLVLAGVAGVAALAAGPALVRQRIAANEAATIADIRTVLTAQATYQAANGGYFEGNLPCMSRKGGCIPSASFDTPTFLDRQLSLMWPRSGYARQFIPGTPPVNPQLGVTLSPSSVQGYAYLASPLERNATGVRGFGGDSSGILCWTANGVAPAVDADARLDLATCTVLK